MKRRDFLLGSAGLVGGAVHLGALAETRPCPPSTVQVAGGTVAGVACESGVPADMPAWMQGRQVHEWFQIPGTKLSSCPPTTASFTGRASAKMEAWCGGALRRNGSIYLIGAAGGHGDYSGNEVNALDLRADVPAWVELRPSSPLSVGVNSAGVYLDYRAAARHTYWATHFVNQDDRLVVLPKSNPMATAALDANTAANPGHINAFPGGNVMPSFGATNWRAFDPGNDWDADTIRRTGNPHYARLPGDFSGATGSVGCMNPETGDLYLGASGRLLRWSRDGSAGKWTNLAAMSDTYAASAVDFTRNRILLVGDYGGSVLPRVRNAVTGAVESVTFRGLGADALKMGGYPGAIYDEANDRFLIFKNTTPMTVYTVDPETWEVAVLRASGNLPPSRPQGVNNAAQYVPELKGVVMGHTYSGDVYFMRLA